MEGCDGEEAAYFQVQIRSADEPMTSFYKVSCSISGEVGGGGVISMKNGKGVSDEVVC